ncbi:MAG: shikimate kinase [Burkholderiaceae bacterium]
MKCSLVLVGMPGSGKSTIGRRLAQRLDRPFVDADAELESRCGVSVATVFEIEGEDGFRERESRLLAELIEQPELVVATGGGVVVTPVNRELMKRAATVVFLEATLGELWNRLRNDRKRPLLQSNDPRKRIAQLLETRQPLYESVADLTVRSRRQSAERFTNEIVRALVSAHLLEPAEIPDRAGNNGTKT